MTTHTHTLLAWPSSPSSHVDIIPIFLPFSGCPQRCIFCAQTEQSGMPTRSVKSALLQLQQQLQNRIDTGLPPPDLGFFGGTFTLLPAEDLALCLDFTRKAKQEGLLRHARCSTRPDAVQSHSIIEKLRHAGFTTIELGIQSFADVALDSAKRHYDGTTALRACATVKAQGLQLVVQLMPGMPGSTPEIFVRDVELALAQKADMLRFYPCQVLEGTALANLWRQGLYKPWEMEETLYSLAKGWLAATDAKVHVIRMGLAPEAGLEEHILAGPRHPALGAKVQALALLLRAEEVAAGRLIEHVSLPRRCQGFLWGDKSCLIPRWAALGVGQHNVHWHDDARILIKIADN